MSCSLVLCVCVCVYVRRAVRLCVCVCVGELSNCVWGEGGRGPAPTVHIGRPAAYFSTTQGGASSRRASPSRGGSRCSLTLSDVRYTKMAISSRVGSGGSRVCYC